MSFGGPHLLAPLSSLLGIRAGMTVSVHHAPAGFLEALLPLPEGCALVDSSKLGLDVQVLFATRKPEVVEKLLALTHGMAVLGSIWVCFPTVTHAPHHPTEDFVRVAGLELGLTDTRKVMLGPDWTSLRLQWKAGRPRVELPQAQA